VDCYHQHAAIAEESGSHFPRQLSDGLVCHHKDQLFPQQFQVWLYSHVLVNGDRSFRYQKLMQCSSAS
jgi:hypothetical protein